MNTANSWAAGDGESFSPHQHIAGFVGAGYEFTEKKDKALLRIGVGYAFHLDEHWMLAPEVFSDIISGGALTWVGGVSIGYGF